MSSAIAILSPVEAYEELMRFAGKFGEVALRLAFHAAVPQSFRADLLHLIKVNFVPEAKDDYTVEADILLSPLCKDIGRGYFQFDPQVRLLLLDNLVKTYSVEEIPRINRVANFILSYANYSNRLTSGNSDRLWKEYLETQRWVALAFINPESAAIQFAECLQYSVENKDIVTRLQLSGLAASLSAPLAAYSQLVNYASALQTAETQGHAKAFEKYGNFLEQEIVVGDIKLRPVSKIIVNKISETSDINRNEENIKNESDLSLINNSMPGFIHSSPAMTSLVEEVYKIRSSDVTVLVTGESGTGKELVSRAIHAISNRKDRVFIPFNCTAVPKELAEGHLFGYRKGAFTGAVTDSLGMIRAAHGGTLFLDEVGDLSLNVQPKLLRFLQEGEVQPIGERSPIKVDVRVIAATNMTLEEKVANGSFREDLYYRLNVIRLRIPPLRERRSEIPELVNYYLNQYSSSFGKRNITITPQTIDLLMVCEWEGNVRQLFNEIERVVARAVDGEVITPEHLSLELRKQKNLNSDFNISASENTSNNFFNVPDFSKNSLSVNRKKLLEEIWNLFNQNDSSKLGIIERGINIVGMAGLGKTHLASEYARQYRNNYPNGVYWLDASRSLDAYRNLDSQIWNIAKQKGWITESNESWYQDAPFSVEKYKLFGLSDCLFIFDNVENFEDIKDYLNTSETIRHILLTSRERISEFYPIELKTLEFNESRVLLLQFSNRTEPSRTEDEQLRELIKNLGSHPMSLISVGTFLAKNPQISFGEFNELLEEISPESIKLYLPSDDHTEEDKISVRLLKISEKIFTKKYPSNEVLKILIQSSSSGMGISLLRELVGMENISSLQKLLNEAIDLNLAIYNEKTGRYAPNSLLFGIKGVEKNMLADKKDWAETIAARLIEWFEERVKILSNYTEFEHESDNLLAWQRNISESNSLTAINITLLSAKYSRSREDYTEAQKLAENSLGKYFVSSTNRDEKLLASIYAELWMINFLKANYQKSLEYILQQLEILRNLEGDNSSELAVCQDNAGRTFEMLGDFHQALENYNRALETKQKFFGNKTLEIANSFEHISSVYLSLHKYENALNFQQQLLNVREELLGKNHPQVAVSLSNIGESYNHLKNHNQALVYQRQAFEILNQNSDNSNEIEIVEERLVLLLIRSEQLEEAEKLLLRSRDKDHINNKTFSLLGTVYKKLWKRSFDDGEFAEQYLDKAIAAFLRAFDEFSDKDSGFNAVFLMELKEPPDPRREKLLPEVRRATEQIVAEKTRDYWDYASLLVLAVLAKDEKQARIFTDRLLVGEDWQLKSTLPDLRLIIESWGKRGERIEWIKNVEKDLVTKITPVSS